MDSRYKVALAAARLAIEVAIEQCLDELKSFRAQLAELLDGHHAPRSKPFGQGLWE